MVDCRLCKESDRVYSKDSDSIMIVCCKYEMIVRWNDVITGDCESYVDVDCDDTPLREYEA